MNNMLNLAKRIVESYRLDGMLIRNYPILVNQGVPAGWVHSLVISHMVILGNALGYMSLADIGISDKTTHILTRDMSIKRPDPVWLEPEDATVKVVTEVESSNMIEKAKNLVKFCEHVGSTLNGIWEGLCCLIWWGSWDESFWTQSRTVICRGFTEEGISFKPPQDCMFIILRLHFLKRETAIRFIGASLVDVIRNSVTKRKIVAELQDLLSS